MDKQELHEMIESLKQLIYDDDIIMLPDSGSSMSMEAKNQKFDFIFDISRQGYRRKHCTFQLRDKHNKSKILMRFDFIGKNHPNPPGNYEYADMNIPCPHVHIATHEFGMAVALPLDAPQINMYLSQKDYDDILDALSIFLERINIANRLDFKYNLNEDII